MFEQVKFCQVTCDLNRSSPKLLPFCRAPSFSMSENRIFFTLLEGKLLSFNKKHLGYLGRKTDTQPLCQLWLGKSACPPSCPYIYSPVYNNMHQALRAVGFWGYASAMKAKQCSSCSGQAGFGSCLCSSLTCARRQLGAKELLGDWVSIGVCGCRPCSAF